MSLRPKAKIAKSRIAIASVEKKIEAMINGVRSDDPSLQLNSTTKFRKILSTSNNLAPHTEKLIEYGVVPRFVEFLAKQDSPKLQHEAAWVITNIAFTKPEVVIDLGAVPILVQLLASPNDEVTNQAIWALSNVAGDSIQCRDYVLSCGALTPLCSKLNKNTTKLHTLRTGAWTLLNFFRDTPLPLLNQVRIALPTLKRLLHSNDEQVLLDACLVLWHMSYGIQNLIEAGFVPRLVQLLQHTSPYVPDLVLSIIWNTVSKDFQQIQFAINCGVLPILGNILTQQDYEIKKEAFRMIINITAGSKKQIQSVIDANLIPTLVNLAQNTDLGIKEEAVWAISNATSGGSHDQIKSLVEQSCIKPLCDFLVCQHLITISVCLDGLENILMAGKAGKNIREVNCYAQMIKDAKGLAKIENLQSHENNEIMKKAVKILETYWPVKEDRRDTNNHQGDDLREPSSS